MIYKPEAFPMKCSCGKTYTQAEWEKLEFGFIQAPVEISGVPVNDALEGRICPNHGTYGSHVTVPLA